MENADLYCRHSSASVSTMTTHVDVNAVQCDITVCFIYCSFACVIYAHWTLHVVVKCELVVCLYLLLYWLLALEVW